MSVGVPGLGPARGYPAHCCCDCHRSRSGCGVGIMGPDSYAAGLDLSVPTHKMEIMISLLNDSHLN